MIQVPYEVSKFLHLQALLTPEELEMFFTSLGPFEIYDNARVVAQMAPFSKEEFFDLYRKYYQSLKGGEKCSIGAFAMSSDPTALKGLTVSEGKVIIKPRLPVIQLKEHAFALRGDGEFTSNIHGEELVRWGIELIFPQIFVDPASGNMHYVMKEEEFLNGELFRRAMKWIRYNTRPPAFYVDNQLRRATFRLGLQAFEETREMIDLSKHSLSVKLRSHV